MANLLFSKLSATADAADAGYTLLDEMTSGAVSIAGTSSVVLLIFHITPEDTSTNETTIYRFTVDGSATGSPEASAFMDNVNDGSGVTMVWAVDGLSAGNHTFTVEWKNALGTPATATDRNRSFQVIEFDTDATIKVDKASVSLETTPASYADMADMDGTFTTASGAMHLILTSVAPWDSNDDSTDFRFAIDDAREGPESSSWNDKANELSGLGMMYAKTGLSAASHKFALQWKIRLSNPKTNVNYNRIFQVIEFADNFALVNHAAAGSTSAQDDPANFANMTDMTATVTPDSSDSVLLVIACGVMGSIITGDNSARFQIADDGTREGPEIWSMSDLISAVPGFLLAWAKTGETAQTVWSLQWESVFSDSVADTSRERWFQVIDFKKAGGGTTVAMDAGSYTFTGRDFTATVASIILMDAGSHAFTGQDITIPLNVTVTMNSNAFDFQGQPSTITRQIPVEMAEGSFTLTGLDPGITLSINVQMDKGSYQFSGLDPTVQVNVPVAMDAGSYTFSGQDITIPLVTIVNMDAGSYTLNGLDLTMLLDSIILMDAGAHAFSGLDMTIPLNTPVTMDTGTFTFSGLDLSVPLNVTVDMEAGSYTHSGLSVDVTRALILDMALGGFTLSGHDPAVTRQIPVDMAKGAFTISGLDLEVQVNSPFDADAGSFTFTGLDLTIPINRAFDADTGTFTFSGLDPVILISELVAMDAGSYTFTGLDADIIMATRVDMDKGGFTFTGFDAAVHLFGAGTSRHHLKLSLKNLP